MAFKSMMEDPDSIVYDAIVQYFKDYGYAPSVRELCEITGFKSTSSVHFYLKRLEAKKMIRCGFGARAIALVGYELTRTRKGTHG